jgi:hypothetical protein
LIGRQRRRPFIATNGRGFTVSDAGNSISYCAPSPCRSRAVTVNGKSLSEFNKDKETITLKALTGTVAVTVQY